MQISTGARIASFEIRAHIGAGGMGSVYRAHDTKLRRDVAIKILQDRFAEDRDYLRRFEREARSASALNHPNIITVYEIDDFDGAPFIAMELIEGTRLRDILKQGPSPLRKLLNIATQIAQGLAAAHDCGIVHRDIKPENVMLTKQGLVKILDFGLARGMPRADSEESTAELITGKHHVIGTAAYMSPEQACGKAIDFHSDQFSFGAVLYEMATGRRAFHRDSTAETIHAITAEEPEPIQRINPRIPAPLCWIIERCLAKDPQDRYVSTTDLARELQTIRDRLPDTGPGDALLPRMPGKRRALIGAAALVAGILIATVIAFSDRFHFGPPPIKGRRYVAVLPFEDVSGQAGNQLFSRGLAEAVSTRLGKYSGLQVIPPTSSASLVASGADEKRIAQELGATLLLKATVERKGDSLKINYALTDSANGATLARDTVSGPADNIWTAQDEVSEAIARRLGIEEKPASTQQAELVTAEEQDLYLRALGNLQNHEDEKAIDAALSLLRELLENASESPLVHSALGRVYLEKYNLTKDRNWSEKAIRAADRARAIAPASPDVLLTLATVQRFTGRFNDAIATYKRALGLQPNSPESVIGLAKSYQGVGQIEDAERSFRRGIALRPTWWSGHNELGVLFLTRGRYDEASREFNEVIKLNPRSVWGYSNLGAVHIYKGQLPEAIAAYTKVLSIREDPAAYSNLGQCYYDLGQYDKSADSYRKAAALKPKLGTYWANLADACRWTTCRNEIDSAIAKAIDLLNEELAVNPKNARAHGTLAVCLAKQGRHPEAREHISKALEIEPKNPARMFQAARVANFTGDASAAVSWLRRAAEAGFGTLEIRNDPEFNALRGSKVFRSAFPNNSQGS